MAWQIELVTIVRNLIHDLDTPPTYSQSRLEETILVNAQLLNKTVDFPNDYTIDVDAITLSPDPTEGTKDIGFINLVCLKTAVMITYGELKTAANQSIEVRDGPSSISLGGIYKAVKDLHNELKEQFELEKVRYQAGNSKAGHGVLGPTTVDGLYTGYPFT